MRSFYLIINLSLSYIKMGKIHEYLCYNKNYFPQTYQLLFTPLLAHFNQNFKLTKHNLRDVTYGKSI